MGRMKCTLFRERGEEEVVRWAPPISQKGIGERTAVAGD